MEKFTSLLNDVRTIENSEVSDDNIFLILNKVHDERTHCRILLYLMKKYWQSFCEICLKDIVRDWQTESVQTAECEHACEAIYGCNAFQNDKKGSIDIYLETDKSCFAFEVKIYAEDQKLQLLRYYNFLEKQKHGKDLYLIYLTLDGKDPSDDSIYCKQTCGISECHNKLAQGKEFYNIGICKGENSIFRWLEEIKEKNDIAGQYYEILSKERYSMKVVEEICKSDAEFEAAGQIFENYMQAVDTIIRCFIGEITEKLREKGFTVITDKQKIADYNDKNNTKFVALKDDTVFSVCIADNLYCRRRTKGAKSLNDLNEWHYITKEWFTETVDQLYNNEKTDKNIHIEAKRLFGKENPIVKWYFEKENQINWLVVHLIRYANREI